MPRTATEKARVHAKRAHHCSCGAITHGNGGKAQHAAMHERRADGHRSLSQEQYHACFVLPAEQAVRAKLEYAARGLVTDADIAQFCKMLDKAVRPVALRTFIDAARDGGEQSNTTYEARRVAVRAVGHLHAAAPTRAQSALRWLLQDADPYIRSEAVAAVGLAGPKAVDALADELRAITASADNSDGARSCAADLLLDGRHSL